jgi:hypothetical protein
MSLTIRLIAVFVATSTWCTAQKWEEVTLAEFQQILVESERLIPVQTSYAIDVQHVFFNSHEGQDTVVTNRSVMVYNHTKGLLNFEQAENLYIQDKQHLLMVDTVNKMLVIQQANPALQLRKTIGETSELSQLGTKVQRKKTASHTQYSVSLERHPRFVGFEIWFNNQGFTGKYVLFARTSKWEEWGDEPDQVIEPRMEVLYSNYRIGKSAESTPVQTISTFLQVNGELNAQPGYKEFELIDLRKSN